MMRRIEAGNEDGRNGRRSPDGKRDRAGGAARAGRRDARCCCCTAWTRSTRTRGFSTCSAREAEIIAPSSPGFGNTKRPPDFDTIYDLVHLYLALLDELPFERVALLGLSFGGWLAAEIAVACAHKLDRLILADPVGIKLGDRETRDIADVFNLNPAEVRRRAWHDPAKAPSYDAMSDDELVIHARNREALCLYAWHPCLYNPQLKNWLGRIRVPTLVLWGDSDRIVTPEYGRAYAGLIPGARFETDRSAPATIPRSSSRSVFAEQVAAFLRGIAADAFLTARAGSAESAAACRI